MKLWLKILLALIFGIITGTIFGESVAGLKVLGTIFLGMINMLIVPLIFSSMIVGVAGIDSPKTLGRVGLRTLILFLFTTIISIIVGLFLADLTSPGLGVKIPSIAISTNTQQPTQTLSEILTGLIPQNPIKSMAEGNIIHVIMFSIFLAVATSMSGKSNGPFLSAIQSLSDIMLSLTKIIMEFSPIGVFGIMAWMGATFGLKVLMPLFQFIMVYYFGCIALIGILYCPLLKFYGRLQPWPFFKGMGDAIILAFSTTSSSATLPATLHCTQKNLGVPKSISNFVLPLGSTINMNGTSMFQAMTVIFLTQVYGIELSLSELIIIVVTATLSAVGTAGVPGGALVMLAIVLAPLNIPLEGIAIIAGIDRLRDMIGTVFNIVGDALCSVLVAKAEGTLDENIYYHIENHKFES